MVGLNSGRAGPHQARLGKQSLFLSHSLTSVSGAGMARYLLFATRFPGSLFIFSLTHLLLLLLLLRLLFLHCSRYSSEIGPDALRGVI